MTAGNSQSSLITSFSRPRCPAGAPRPPDRSINPWMNGTARDGQADRPNRQSIRKREDETIDKTMKTTLETPASLSIPSISSQSRMISQMLPPRGCVRARCRCPWSPFLRKSRRSPAGCRPRYIRPASHEPPRSRLLFRSRTCSPPSRP